MNKELIEYEEIKGKNPITGAIEVIKIEKVKQKTPEKRNEEVKAQLNKYGLQPISEVEIEDPFTGEKRLITLDRTGHSEEKLVLALTNPDLKRDQKDFALSMYLYEHGRESMSFVTDLIRYKGTHTKETRAFKSQMRFDYEQFVDAFCQYLEEQVTFTNAMLAVDVSKEKSDFLAFVEEREREDVENKKEAKKYDYLDYVRYKKKGKIQILDRIVATNIMNAMHAQETAQYIRRMVKRISEARQREKGKGIYISREGKPFMEDDPELDDIIKADREAREKEFND